jgi:hypothetical protein
MRLKSARYRGRTRGSVEIHTPPTGAPVSERGAVAGSATLPDDLDLWVLVRRHDVVGWWPQGEQAVPVSRKQWSVSVKYGEPTDAGFDFEIAALLVGQATHDLWTDWVARARETGRYPPVQLPSAQFIAGEAYRTVTHIEQ